jgi:hypothetical protein
MSDRKLDDNFLEKVWKNFTKDFVKTFWNKVIEKNAGINFGQNFLKQKVIEKKCWNKFRSKLFETKKLLKNPEINFSQNFFWNKKVIEKILE